MSQNKKQIRIQSRVDTAEMWTSENPILLDKELGYERDSGRYKIGDGQHHWNDLLYSNMGRNGTTTKELNDAIELLDQAKVNIMPGKQLSTNDFNDEYKTKIDNTENLINTKITTLVGAAPAPLNTLEGLANALDNDPNFFTTITNLINTKEQKAFYKTTYLNKDKWDSNGIYSFEDTYPSAQYDIEIFLCAEDTTLKQIEAYMDAQIIGYFNTNAIKALETCPTIDIPIILKITEK